MSRVVGPVEWLVAGVMGCADPCETVTELAVTHPIRHALFIEVNGAQLETASSHAGHVVRATCDDGVHKLDRTLRSDGSVDVSYDYDDERAVRELAIDEEGTIAVVTFELEYIGDIDEKSVTRLTVFERDGSRRWSQVLAQDEYSSDYSGLAIGPDQCSSRRGSASSRRSPRTRGPPRGRRRSWALAISGSPWILLAA